MGVLGEDVNCGQDQLRGVEEEDNADDEHHLRQLIRRHQFSQREETGPGEDFYQVQHTRTALVFLLLV